MIYDPNFIFAIQALLKSDEVQFVAIPVFSNDHIMKELALLEDAKFVRSLIFINCGGVLNMTEQPFYEKEDIKCYLMDCHRPYDHRNINDE